MNKTKPSATRAPVRALTRGLNILQYVNSVGSAKPVEISKQLNIPRSSVYRLLQTLEEMGYIAFSSSNTSARVTILAASLGDSSQKSSLLCQIAAPLLAEYSDKIIWPMDLSIYNNIEMVIHETTHGRSPMSIDSGMIGYRLPLLRTSAGRAYLGHCGQSERNIIIRHLQKLNHPEDHTYLIEKNLNKMILEVQQNGFGARVAGEFQPKTSSVALPIFKDGIIIGCLSMIWIKTAMSLDEAMATNGDDLKQLVSLIQQALNET